MDSRRYIRHPSDIPIEYSMTDESRPQQHPLTDIGKGGLSFHVEEPLPPGQRLQLCIPSIRPDLHIESIVTWCEKDQTGYQIGIRFLNDEDRFTMRMVEQICYIETYRQQILDQDGRELSAAQAAEEWIARYAGEFPEP